MHDISTISPLARLRRSLGLAIFGSSIVISRCLVFSPVHNFSDFNYIFLLMFVGLLTLGLGVFDFYQNPPLPQHKLLIIATTALALLGLWVTAVDPMLSSLATLSCQRTLIWLQSPFLLYYSTKLKDFEIKTLFMAIGILTFYACGEYLNPNIHSMLLIASVFPLITNYSFGVRFSIVSIFCAYALYFNATQAVIFGLTAWFLGHLLQKKLCLRHFLYIIIVTFVALAIARLGAPHVFQDRDLLFLDAFTHFQTRPLIGDGTHEYYARGIPHLHAHNTIITIVAERGLIGLTFLLIVIRESMRAWRTGPKWAQDLLLFFIGWSIVDDPMHVLGVHSLLIVALSQLFSSRFSDSSKSEFPYARQISDSN